MDKRLGEGGEGLGEALREVETSSSKKKEG